MRQKGGLGHPTLVFLKEYAHPALAPAGLQKVIFLTLEGRFWALREPLARPKGSKKMKTPMRNPTKI